MRAPLSADRSTAWFDQLARGWRGYVLIGLLALTSALMGAGRMPVLDRDEARFAQATRQMLETGDYVRIRVQNDERNKKPIGIHWLQSAAVEAASPLTQRLNEIWPYRLPSAIGAALAAMAALWAGRALLPRRVAFLGAALFASCMLLGAEGMIAKTDAALAGFTTVTMAALARLYAPTSPSAPPKALALIFWIALGCGVLIKGPVTPLVAALTLGALIIWERRWDWMKPLAWWPGPLLAVLIVAPWMIAIGAATQGRFFIEAVSADLAPKLTGGSEGHAAPPGFHLVLLPFLIFPATFALPGAARLGWRVLRAKSHDEADAHLRFLVAWIVPSFVLFEILPTKLPHYPLPTYPALALLCAAALVTATRERWRTTTLVGITLFALAGAVLVAALAAGATFLPGDTDADLRRAITAGLIGALVLAAAIAALVLVPRPSLRVAAAIAAALVFSYSLRDRILPEARTLHVSAEATAALTRARLLPREDRQLWVAGYRETSLVFDTRTSIRLATPEEVGAQAALGDALLIESRALAAADAELARRGLIFARQAAPVRGLNYGNGDRVALYLGDVEEAPTTPRLR